jgi:hypothetical protein
VAVSSSAVLVFWSSMRDTSCRLRGTHDQRGNRANIYFVRDCDIDILYVISLRTRMTDPDLVGSGSVVRVTPPIEATLIFYSILYVISLRTRTTDPDLVGSGSVVRVTPPIEPSLTLFSTVCRAQQHKATYELLKTRSCELISDAVAAVPFAVAAVPVMEDTTNPNRTLGTVTDPHTNPTTNVTGSKILNHF